MLQSDIMIYSCRDFSLNKPGMRNERIKVEKNRAIKMRMLKELSRPKILIESVPNQVNSPAFDLKKAKIKYSKHCKSTYSLPLTRNSSMVSETSRVKKKTIKRGDISENRQMHEYLPDWLMLRADFKEACKQMEIKEQDAILQIIETHHLQRPCADKKLLESYIQSLSFFKELPKSVVSETGNRLTKHEHPRGTKIITKGEIADSLFIIYKGSVSILLDNIKIAEKSAGEVFGDLALDNRLTRSSDVVAETNCITLKLLREDYEMAILSTKSKQNHKNFDFLQKLSVFSKWSPSRLLRLSSLLSLKTVPKGTVLYERSLPSVCIYFIKKGVVDIYHYVPIEHSNKWPTSFNKWRVHKVNREYLVKVASVNEDEYFGETEVRQNSARVMKAVAQTDAFLLILNKDHFYENFHNHEIEEFCSQGVVRVPEIEALRQKVIGESSARIITENALLDALQINFTSLQGRENNPKLKKLSPWLKELKHRRTESHRMLKKSIVSEDASNIIIEKPK